MNNKNYYEILGVKEDATTEEIQQEFEQRFLNAKIMTDEPDQLLEPFNLLLSPDERAVYDETRLLERKARLEAHLQSIKTKEPRLPAWVGYVTLALFVGIPVFYFWSAYRAETPLHSSSPCKDTQKIVTIHNREVTSVEEYDNCSEQYFLQ